MKKTELIEAVAHASGLTLTKSAKALNALQEVIEANLAFGDDVVITGFLTLKPVSRRARAVRNPRTGEMTEVPARQALRVTPSASFVREVFQRQRDLEKLDELIFGSGKEA